MQLQEHFITEIRTQQLFAESDPLLLAVSGGLDSVTLGELCKQSGYRFAIAHANFGLRAEESDGDEQFVRDLAGRFGVDFYCNKFETLEYASTRGVSIQVAARELRYAWFEKLLAEHGYRWLLTAHHRDDNIETMLMNFFRGTGIAGLRGMQPKNGKIVRPLLNVSRAQLQQFAIDQNLKWREDSSNASDKYSRNYFRHHIVPSLISLFPNVENNLAENIIRFRDVALLYEQAIQLHRRSLVEQKGNEYHIPLLKLRKTKPLNTVLFELIRPFGFDAAQLPDITRLLDGGQGKFVASRTHRIIRNRKWLIVSPLDSVDAEIIPVESDDTHLHTPLGDVVISRSADTSFVNDADTAILDARQVTFPLLFRRWKAGDYFYPLGMPKKKKVSRFLIDKKLSPTEKEQVWVVESDKRICWIVGLRIDHRFRITDQTRETLRISLKR